MFVRDQVAQMVDGVANGDGRLLADRQSVTKNHLNCPRIMPKDTIGVLALWRLQRYAQGTAVGGEVS